ncbi:MAG: hypothetical protein HYU66_23035 [Armatimonadetes bacterium]|nr:hypothetical protein [Armatimonadota bacterium]
MDGRALMELVKPDAGGRTSRQLIVPIGRWYHPQLGVVEYTAERVQRYFDLYTAGVRRMKLPEPPIGPGGEGLMISELHDLQGQANGYLFDPELTPQGIVATCFWTDAGLQGVLSGELCHLSPEFLPDYVDPDKGTLFKDVWDGAGQVGRCFLDLPTIAIRFGDQVVGLVAFGDPEVLMPKTVTIPPDPSPSLPTAEVPPPATAPGAEPPAGTEQPGGASPAPTPEAQVFADPAVASLHAEVLELRSRDEARERELAVERRERMVVCYRDELRSTNFGDAQTALAMIPATRDPLANELADLPADKARRIMDLVKSIRLCPMDVIGFDAPERIDTDPAKRLLSAADRAAMEQAGLTEEAYRRGMNTHGRSA